MSKNFNLLYVFSALLLQFFIATSVAGTKETAVTQRNALIKKHGLIDSPLFNQQCTEISKRLNIKHQCLLLDSNTINAYAFSDGAIMVSWGLFKLTQNSDQFAHIIAHESNHITQNHHQELAQFIAKPPVFFPKKKLMKFRLKQEKAADIAASQQLKKAGYDTAQIHHIWHQLLSSEIQNKWTDHQSLSHRIDLQMLKLPLNKSAEWQSLIHDLSQR